MSKMSIIEEVGRISASDKPKENPFAIQTNCMWCDHRVIKGRKVCWRHASDSITEIKNPYGDNYPIGYVPE